MDTLVGKLIKDKHPVEFEKQTENLVELRHRIENGFVFIKFTQTQGGTEVGINLDAKHSKLESLQEGKGIITVVGTCELNFHKVRCYAEIDLKSRSGLGHLELIDNVLDAGGPKMN